MYEEFVDEWQKLAKDVEREKGNMMFEMAKPLVGATRAAALLDSMQLVWHSAQQPGHALEHMLPA
jgi:hypothetical protein